MQSEVQSSGAPIVVPDGHPLRRLQPIGLAIAAVGLVACAVLGASSPAAFLHSYLVAFLFWLSLALGGLIFVLIQHVARAGWSIVVRRLAENAMGVVPVFVALFLPILLGAHQLYEWMDAAAVAKDPVLASKAGYLNPTFFVIRAAVIFAAWIGMAWIFRSRSVAQDTSGDRSISASLRGLSGACIVVFAFATTFAAFDWIMSLQPRWYSTIFGGYFFAGAFVGFIGFLTLAILFIQSTGLLADTVTLEHFYDLGKLLFAFVVFWAYIAFSQFMLIWYANIPEETIFFEHRFEGSWLAISRLLLFGHFLVPFFFLMPKTIKRMKPALALGALWVLLMHYLDMYWLVMPLQDPAGFSPSVIDLATFLLCGGLFVAAFARLCCGASLVPARDPRLDESLAFENV